MLILYQYRVDSAMGVPYDQEQATQEAGWDRAIPKSEICSVVIFFKLGGKIERHFWGSVRKAQVEIFEYKEEGRSWWKGADRNDTVANGGA